MQKINLTILIVIELASMIVAASSVGANTCTKPQVIYHLAGTSLFFKIPDIQEALLQISSIKLKEISYDVSTTFPPHTEYYKLKNIVPTFNYNPSTEVESLSQDTIVKSGGKMSISVEFDYDYRNGAKLGSGKGEGKFSKEFDVVLTKKANYVVGQGLQWTCTFTDLVLENMLFLKLTGGEMDMKTTTTFTSLLNQNLGANYECVKSQLETSLKQIQPKINELNNNQVQVIYGSSQTYAWGEVQMDIDESLVGYSLSGIGENSMILAVPQNGISCYDIINFSQSQDTYYAVSKSLIENSYNYLANNQKLFSNLDPLTWQIPNFYFTVRDLAFAMPQITHGNSLNDEITGGCIWTQGPAPVYNATSNGFDLNMKYACNLKTKKNTQLILNFVVQVYLSLIPQYDAMNSVKVVVQDSTFQGSEFQPASNYGPVQNEDLLNYFIGQAARSLVNTNVFGSGLIYLPPDTQNASWEVSQDGSTIYFFSMKESNNQSAEAVQSQ